METYEKPRGWYRWYVLGLFTLVYAFNFIDRQIVSILAPSLKADLGLTDAQVGLLFGTAFALFYALFGLPLAKIADGWHRVRTLSIGLTIWSAMTAASGFATSFGALAAARIGVGVGEASAAPSAFSVLQDYFTKAERATALAIYASGIYIGAGVSLIIGGQIVSWWEAAYPIRAEAPLGFAGWQAAYLAVGLPGILLALLVILTVREPVRGAIDGNPQPGAAGPFGAAMRELGALFPPFSLFTLRSLGASAALIWRNLIILVLSIVAVWALTVLTNSFLTPAKLTPMFVVGGFGITTNLVQWTAMGIALYAVASWATALRLRDPVAAALMTRTPSFVALSVAGGLHSFASYGFSAFLFLYGTQSLGMKAADGFTLGAVATIAGGLGTVLGGLFADRARVWHPSGRIYVACLAVFFSTIFSIWQLSTTSVTQFYIAYFLGLLSSTMWLGSIFATGQDHVLPRMRGSATAIQFLGINLIGLGLGPYWVGLASDITGDLRLAMMSVLLLAPIVIGLFLFAAARFPAVETSVIERARAAGEPL